MLNRRRNREYPIETWEEIKTVIRKRFVPTIIIKSFTKNYKTLGRITEV